MLNPSLQLEQTLQFDLLPEDKSVLTTIPIENLIKEQVEFQSRATVVGKTLGEELKRTSTMLVPRLRMKLAESANSLKATLETTEACREKMQQDQIAAKEIQEALKVDLARIEAKRNQILKEKVDDEAKEKALAAKMEKCFEFML